MVLRFKDVWQTAYRYRNGLIRWLLLLGTTLLLLPLNAQIRRPQNRPYADYRHFHLGFHVGMNVQDLAVFNSGASFGSNPARYGTIAMYSPGFSVGMIGNWSPVIGIDIRLIPTLHLGERALTYTTLPRDENTPPERFGLRSNLIEIPLMIKYSSRRLNNVRPYVTAGFYGAVEIGQKRNPEVLFKPFDYGVKVGLGCDFYLPYFKLSPELCFSFGFSDVVEHNRPDMTDDVRLYYTTALSKALSRMIVLTFNFE